MYLNFKAESKDEGRKIKSILKNNFGMSSSLISKVKLCEDGILLNGERAFTNAVVHGGDSVAVRIDDTDPPQNIVPIDVPLDVVFEDEFLLVINKPAGMAVHAGALSADECTVANAVANHLGKPFVFHPVNRLDRGTTGLMVVAKSAYIHEKLKAAIHTGDFFREYRAVAKGIPEKQSGEITLPIGRADGSAIKRTVCEDGDEARTVYEVLSQKDGNSFLRLLPLTGRTHQLRVHMSAIGHPLVGDWLYGKEERDVIARPALHSYYLSLTHPITLEKKELFAPIPDDMRKLI